VIVRREVLHGRLWSAFPTYVVADDPGLLALFVPTGSPLAFPDWPYDRWHHPWHVAGYTKWSGHGKLMLHRPTDAYSVDVYWSGDDRVFAGWYINLQEPIRRHRVGVDTLDHELDFWQPAVGQWEIKDEDLFERRVQEGRYSSTQAESIRATGVKVAKLLDERAFWWDDRWAGWMPPDSWLASPMPTDWDTTPAANGLLD